MASHEIAEGAIACNAQTLTANTVDTVTIKGDIKRLRIINAVGPEPIYRTVNGEVPTVGGSNAEELPAGSVLEDDSYDSSTEGQVVVKLISEGTPTYSVSVKR